MIILLAPLLVFLVIGLSSHYYAWNTPLFVFINSMPLGSETFWQCVTFLGDGLAAFALLVFFVRAFPMVFWQALLIALVLTLLCQGAKHLFLMARPAAILSAEQIHIIGPALRHYSFPSGHSVTAFALAALLAHHLNNPWRWLLISLASLIAWSRVVVGAHWPTDVIVGGALGWYGTQLVLRYFGHLTWGYKHKLGITMLHSLCLLTLLALWWHNGSYPQATWLARALGLNGLGVWAWQWLPALRQALQARRTPASE